MSQQDELNMDIVQQGARFREMLATKGTEHTAVYEIVEHERPHVHAAYSAIMGMKVTDTFHYITDGSAVPVTLDVEVKDNVLWTLFVGMVSRALEKEGGDCLNYLMDAIDKSKQLGSIAMKKQSKPAKTTKVESAAVF